MILSTQGPFLGRNRIEVGLVGRLRSYIVSHSHGLKLTSRGVKVAARIIAPLTFGDCNSILWFSVHCPIVCSSGARTLSEYVVLQRAAPSPQTQLIDCPAQPNYHTNMAQGYLFRQNFFKDGQKHQFPGLSALQT